MPTPIAPRRATSSRQTCQGTEQVPGGVNVGGHDEGPGEASKIVSPIRAAGSVATLSPDSTMTIVRGPLVVLDDEPKTVG